MVAVLSRISAFAGRVVGRVKRFVSEHKVSLGAGVLALALYGMYRSRGYGVNRPVTARLDPERTVDVPIVN